MSKDYREQSQLEDEADEKYLTMYQYYKEQFKTLIELFSL